MKTNLLKTIFSGALACLLCTTATVHAQQRFGGGGGGGGGGFGGFGGFGGGGGNRGGGGTSGSGQFNNNGTVGSAMISVDPVTHNIIVIADKETSDQIGRVIASLDEPIAQVLIKVVFLEVQRNDSSEIGVQGTYTGGALSKNLAQISGYLTNYTVVNQGTPKVGLAPSTITPLYNNSAGSGFGLPTTLAGASGNGGVYQVIGSDFTATLQAVAQAGRAEVLARPSILARDGQLAKIVIGQEIYLPNSVTPGTSSGLGVATATTINGTYTEVGIILNVTPFIGANDLVQMIVQPQTSSLDTSSQGQQIASGGILSSPIFAPNINLRSADTVVVTPDAQTVVIGGLISNNRSTADTKVPFLGDIPLFGQLFKSSNKVEGKTELMMFLTPHIVHAPAQLTGVSSTEIGKAMLISNSISEKLLDQYLERIPAKKKK